jgi:hypothetical protein
VNPVSDTEARRFIARYPFVTAARKQGELRKVNGLITQGGDDGTRTHDPLLANTPDLDGGERWRTTSPDQNGFTDGGERWRTAADVRQMFDRAAIR